MSASASPARPKSNIPLGLLILAVIGAAFYLAANALMSPWIYTVGSGRVLPEWQGVADAAGPGGTYRLYISVHPSFTRVAGTHVRGNGWVCTPTGGAIAVKVGGGTQRSVWRTMEGEAFRLYTFGYSATAAANGRSAPPRLDFSGRWEDGALALKDAGTLDAAFTSSGALREAPVDANGPTLPVSFREERWGFLGMGKPCGTAR